MLNFPDPGDTIEIQLFEPPVKNGETPAEFKKKKEEYDADKKSITLRIKLISRPAYVRATYAIRNAQAAENRRVYELRKNDPEKLDPELHEDHFVTQEFIEQTDAWARDVMTEALEGAGGFLVAGKPVEAIEDKEKLIEVLARASWLEVAAGRALAKQTPGTEARFL